MTYYPSCISLAELCNDCNTGEYFAGCADGNNGSVSCSAYCNSGCNVICNSSCQAICNVHSQYIKNHADVGTYPGSNINPNDFIHEKWTTDYWNSLIAKVETAGSVGFKSSQGITGNIDTSQIASNKPYTANLYNEVRAKIQQFSFSGEEGINAKNNYTKVNENDLITAAIANAIGTAYNNAKFSSSVCDICNAGTQHYSGSHCACNCTCTCSCPCSCDCDCGCSCSGCSCSGCSCSCSSPSTTE